jgi:alpha-methylacyl-CoA racemase
VADALLRRRGPLADLRVLEFTGLGPAPFAGMLLADMGADVVRVDRPPARPANPSEVTARGKRSIVLDLKSADDLKIALRMAEQADLLIEGFRPDVMERLGLGPDVLLERNPRLIYGRMTGWGQDGPLRQAAGHDLNYIALTGALAAIGPGDGKPLPPLNLVGDFGGGTMFLLYGLLCALHERGRSGRGQVVDAAMVDGVSALLAPLTEMYAAGMWRPQRGRNFLDGGSHFYGTYRCADGHCISIASLEPQFYALLRDRLGLTDPAFDDQWASEDWPALSRRLDDIFATRTRNEWCALLEGSDVCFAPVLDLEEAPRHPHNRARNIHIEVEGVLQPAPAPRLSRTPGAVQAPPPPLGADREAVLKDWGIA